MAILVRSTKRQTIGEEIGNVYILYNQISRNVIANNKLVYPFLVSFQGKNLGRLITNVRNRKEMTHFALFFLSQLEHGSVVWSPYTQ
ncbi:unnamed protein product, partial [Porites evermanni]